MTPGPCLPGHAVIRMLASPLTMLIDCQVSMPWVLPNSRLARSLVAWGVVMIGRSLSSSRSATWSERAPARAEMHDHALGDRVPGVGRGFGGGNQATTRRISSIEVMP